MARQVFFSFHYANDLWRANVVRKSDVIKKKEQEVGRYDHSLWEEAKTKGEKAIQKLIDDGLKGASVTVVLIGAETTSRKWCRYEIAKSHLDGKGLLGVRVHNIESNAGKKGTKGLNPFASEAIKKALNRETTLASLYSVYDWIDDDGYNNIDDWIEAAAKAAGRK